MTKATASTLSNGKSPVADSGEWADSAAHGGRTGAGDSAESGARANANGHDPAAAHADTASGDPG